jgi:hypothetical protein
VRRDRCSSVHYHHSLILVRAETRSPTTHHCLGEVGVGKTERGDGRRESGHAPCVVLVKAADELKSIEKGDRYLVGNKWMWSLMVVMGAGILIVLQFHLNRRK